MAGKPQVLMYISPPELVRTWPERVSDAGFHIDVNPPFTVDLPGVSGGDSILCRSGTVRPGNVSITVAPSAGAHLGSASPVAGQFLILVYYSGEVEGLGPSESELAREFGELLVRAGAIYVPPPGQES
jgi:hypothetical protein